MLIQQVLYYRNAISKCRLRFQGLRSQGFALHTGFADASPPPGRLELKKHLTLTHR